MKNVKTLRPSTNNFKGSDLDDLIAVPAPAMVVVVCWRGRGCYPELCSNSCKTRRGFALKEADTNE